MFTSNSLERKKSTQTAIHRKAGSELGAHRVFFLAVFKDVRSSEFPAEIWILRGFRRGFCRADRLAFACSDTAHWHGGAVEIRRSLFRSSSCYCGSRGIDCGLDMV